jgi:hypothetical protein
MKHIFIAILLLSASLWARNTAGLSDGSDWKQFSESYVGFQQAIAVLGERRRIPDFVVRVQADKPAEQQVVIHLFHERSGWSFRTRISGDK